MNALKNKLRAGKVVSALPITMPRVAFAQIAARSGLDCVVVDMEHGPIDLQTAHAMIAATAGTECTPLVRLPWTQHWLAKPVLDAGAYGLVFPMIADADLARLSVSDSGIRRAIAAAGPG
jgi:4-hydroxy-2-oxoheptanedioate aldolase